MSDERILATISKSTDVLLHSDAIDYTQSIEDVTLC